MTTSPAFIAEVAFSVGAGDTAYLHFDDPSRGKFDTGMFGPADFWVDEAAYVRAASIRRGVSRHDGVYGKADAGQARVVLSNQDRRFDPTNLAGPYVAGGATQIVPMRAFRLRAIWAGVAYDLFRGFADAWAVDYRVHDSTTTLMGTDGTKVVANYDGVAGGIVGTGEDSGARIGRVLDNIAWPAADRDLDAGQTNLQGTDLSANAWAEIVLAADTEIGEVYFDGTGKIVFRRRHAIFLDARSATPQAVFGDAGAGELGYTNLEVAYDDTQVRNLIRISRVGGTQQTAEDPTSQTRYMKRTWGRSDLLMQTDAEALDYARYVLSLQKDAELRFAAITVDPYADPANLWPQVLGRELGDRITIKFTPPGGGARITRDVFIRGITHDIGPKAWRTTWALQDATTKFTFFIFDDPSLGRLDSNAFAF